MAEAIQVVKVATADRVAPTPRNATPKAKLIINHASIHLLDIRLFYETETPLGCRRGA